MPKNFNPFVVPVLLLFSLIPESEKRLGQLAALIEATQSAVQTLRSGMEGFHTAVAEAFFTPDSPNTPDHQNTSSSPGFTTKPAREEKPKTDQL